MLQILYVQLHQLEINRRTVWNNGVSREIETFSSDVSSRRSAHSVQTPPVSNDSEEKYFSATRGKVINDNCNSHLMAFLLLLWPLQIMTTIRCFSSVFV